MSTVFVDRESAYPNRYRVIPDSGPAYYVVLERADEPVTPGTPLNAETFNNMRNEIDADTAPSGFGLGEGNATYVSNCHAINRIGFYRANNNTANKPDRFDNCVIYANIVDGDIYLMATYAEMTARCYYSSYAKAWQPWEYENPPMFTGVEYRTTERYRNYAVYKKVDQSGNILWRKDGESQWHLLSSAGYVAAATVE